MTVPSGLRGAGGLSWPAAELHAAAVTHGGSWGVDFHYAAVGWERTGDTLWLPRDQFRGPWLDALLWKSKPLEQLDG